MVIPMVEKKVSNVVPMIMNGINGDTNGGEKKVSKLISMIMNVINVDTNGWRKGIKTDTNESECYQW